MVPPSQSSLNVAWVLLMSLEPSHTTLKPFAGTVPMPLGISHKVRFSGSLLRYIPLRLTFSSLGLYNSIQLSKLVAGLITSPALEAISSLTIRITDSKVDHISLFSFNWGAKVQIKHQQTFGLCIFLMKRLLFLIKCLVVRGKMRTFAPVQRNERLERVSHFRY